MNYIYDVLLNFKPTLYEFYEWNQTDDITHIRRIPIAKVSTLALQQIKYNRIQLDHSFLQRFKNKTEVFQRKSVKVLEYALILTDGKEAIAGLFSLDELVMRSSLLIDEEEDLLDIAKDICTEEIPYKVLKEVHPNLFQTKKEKELEKYIYRELNKIKSPEKLDYIYFECFNRKTDKNTSALSELKKALKNDFDFVANQIYNILKLTSTKK